MENKQTYEAEHLWNELLNIYGIPKSLMPYNENEKLAKLLVELKT